MSCAHPNIDDKNSASSQQSSGGSGGPCAECDKPAKLRCANCKKNTGQLVFYCSKECQRANWPRHKNFCSLPIPSKMLTGPIIKLPAIPMDSSSQNSDDDGIKLISTEPTLSIIRERLPLELECEIFACLKLPVQRKFISGLGMEIYEMCAPKIRALLQAKKLYNPWQNGWDQSIRLVTISPDGLIAHNTSNSKGYAVFAVHSFPAESPKHCRLDNFPGTIIFYFEVKQQTFGPKFLMGFDNLYAPSRSHTCFLGIGYGSSIGCECGWLICRNWYPFECFEDAIKPEWKWAAREGGNVTGCGLLLNSKNQLAIFGTLNGILLGNPLPIEQPTHCLYPIAMVEKNGILKANFGTDSAKPFEYDIDKCPGLVFE